jgi:hypothetical protein
LLIPVRKSSHREQSQSCVKNTITILQDRSIDRLNLALNGDCAGF